MQEQAVIEVGRARLGVSYYTEAAKAKSAKVRLEGQLNHETRFAGVWNRRHHRSSLSAAAGKIDNLPRPNKVVVADLRVHSSQM